MLEITAGYFGCESQSGYKKWVNGNNYQHSTETFGILPFDGEAQNQLSMLPYHHTFALEQKAQHHYLSERQGTHFSVLPIHTQSEHALFQLYTHSSHHFSGRQGPNFTALACEMNAHADGMTIFYKVNMIFWVSASLLRSLPEAFRTSQQLLQDMAWLHKWKEIYRSKPVCKQTYPITPCITHWHTTIYSNCNTQATCGDRVTTNQSHTCAKFRRSQPMVVAEDAYRPSSQPVCNTTSVWRSATTTSSNVKRNFRQALRWNGPDWFGHNCAQEEEGSYLHTVLLQGLSWSLECSKVSMEDSGGAWWHIKWKNVITRGESMVLCCQGACRCSLRLYKAVFNASSSFSLSWSYGWLKSHGILILFMFTSISSLWSCAALILVVIFLILPCPIDPHSHLPLMPLADSWF